MMKDSFQYRRKLREPSTPNTSGDPPHFPWSTTRGSVRPVGIEVATCGPPLRGGSTPLSSILSLYCSHRPAPPSSSAGLFPHMKLPDSRRNAVRRQRQTTFFRIFLVFAGILLLSGCHGFKFTSGMFDFEALGHGNGSRLKNDTNATE